MDKTSDRLGDPFGDRLGDQFGTYRCPVCGHRDMAMVEPETADANVFCRYCETPLILRRHGWAASRLTVQVAAPPAAS